MQQALTFAYRRFVLGSYFNAWLRNPDEEKAPAGASELIVACSLVVGILWLTLLPSAMVPLLSSELARWLGAMLAFYQVTSIAIVTAYTIFVFAGRIHSTARSLASFLLNIIEVSIYSTIFLYLTSCAPPKSGRWFLFYEHLGSLFRLSVPSSSGATGCVLYSHYELVVGGGILFIMVGSVVGGIVRPELQR